jgi:hypothetical protein
MEILYKYLKDIGKLIFQIIGKNNTQTYNIFTHKLKTLHNELEDIYFKNLLHPQLETIWKNERKSLLVCITCIVYTIKSMDHS